MRRTRRFPSSRAAPRGPVDGPAFLNVRLLYTSTVDESQAPGGSRFSYTGPERIAIKAPALKALEVTCDFEAVVHSVVSVDRRRPFRVYALRHPGRVVVEIDTGEDGDAVDQNEDP